MPTAVQASERTLYWLLAIIGMAAWLLPWLLLNRREAWDHWSYFVVSIPLMTIAAAYAGYQAKARSWRWWITLILAQFAAALLSGGSGNLLPLGAIVFLVLGVPMMIGAVIGAWLGRRKQRHAS